MSSKDILGIINEYVNIPSLQISDMLINDSIEIQGSYKLGGRISFNITVSLISHTGDSLVFKLDKIKLGRFKIFQFVKRFAVSKLLEQLKLKGISNEKDIVIVNFKNILDMLPFYLDFNLEELVIRKDRVTVSAQNVNFSVSKAEARLEPEVENQPEHDINDMIESQVNKVEDSYTKIRKRIEEKIPSKYDRFVEYVFILTDATALLYRLFKDKRVTFKMKATIGAIITYLALPIDIFPDFIPFIGKIDDIALIVYVLNKVIKEVPSYIILENWQGDINTFEKVKDGIKYINAAAGGTNVHKLFEFILKMYQFSKKDKNKI